MQLTPEKLDYALPLANDLEKRGEVYSASLVRLMHAEIQQHRRTIRECRIAMALPPNDDCQDMRLVEADLVQRIADLSDAGRAVMMNGDG